MFVKDIKKGLVGVALLGAVFVGCGDDPRLEGLTKFEPQDEMDKNAIQALINDTKEWHQASRPKDNILYIDEKIFQEFKKNGYYIFYYLHDSDDNEAGNAKVHCDIKTKECEVK